MHVRPVKIANALKFYKTIYSGADFLLLVSSLFHLIETNKDYLDNYL
jgi:hypothetical protein